MEKAVTRRKWTAGLLIAGTVALVVAFWSLIMSMLSLLAVAGVLTLLSLPLCKVLEKRLSSGAAAAIALLTLLGAVLGMLWGLIPPLLRQSAQLMSRLPALLDSLRELLTRWSAALEARGIPLGDMQAELFSRISAAAGQLAATLVSGIRRLTGSVSQWLLAPLLSFYFLRDRKRFCLLLSLVLPVKYRARGIRAAREMRRESALYLRGQLILSLFVAAMTALALLLTRTPGALLLGLFMGAFDQAIPWSTQSAKGCRRFLDRVWRLQENVTPDEGYSEKLNALMHETIKKVSLDYEAMKYNTAIAQMMTLVNEMVSAGSVTRGELKTLLLLLNPVAPHITEEMWENQGFGGTMTYQKWPTWDEDALVKSEIEIAVQVCGKVRGRVMIPADMTRERAETELQQLPEIQKILAGKTVTKVIFVPGRLVNFIAK